jgi:hypothetical protein
MDSKYNAAGNSGASNCSTDITLWSIQAAMQEARELMPDDVPDIYVMTFGAERKLREHFQTDEQPGAMGRPPDGFWADRVCGIPFEAYGTLQECHNRVLELRDEGKKVALVCR